MWFLVTVVKGSKYFSPDSQIANQMLISDTTEMIVTGYATALGAYRFEMRKGNEAFTLLELGKGHSNEVVTAKFLELATQMEATTLAAPSA